MSSPRLSEPRFVQLKWDVIGEDTARLDLSRAQRTVLVELLCVADWQTGLVRNFSLTHFAEACGFGAKSGRRTLRGHLDRLAALELIRWEAPPGRPWGGQGGVLVLQYDRYVKRDVAKAVWPPDEFLTARSSRGYQRLTARSARGKNPITARSARGYSPENGVSPATMSPTIHREDREKDPLPTLPIEDPSVPTTPGREGDEAKKSSPALLLIEAVEAATQSSLFGEPVRRLEDLVLQYPGQLERLVAHVGASRNVRSFNRVIRALETEAERFDAERERQDAERRLSTEDRKRAELRRQAIDRAHRLALTEWSEEEIAEDLGSAFRLPDLVEMGLEEARRVRAQRSETVGAGA